MALQSCLPIKADTRLPAVAGAFYPADSNELAKAVEGFLASAATTTLCNKQAKLVGIIAPHAGYIYSGPTAAVAFKCIAGQNFDRIYFLGVDHRSGLGTISIWPKGAFDTPIGPVMVDASASSELLVKGGLFVDEPLQHVQEHSIEVELPFFLKTIGSKPSVFISVGGSPNNGILLGKELIQVLSGFRGRVLIVASTDWSHYYDSLKAEKLDTIGLASVREVAPEALLADCMAGKTELCGLNGVLALLTIMRAGNAKAHILERSDSSKGSNDSSRVVGYGAVLLEGDIPSSALIASVSSSTKLTSENISKEKSMNFREETLACIRKTLEAVLAGESVPKITFNDSRFQEKCGVFVTLKKDGDLRGCIGFIEGVKPLAEGIQEMAIAAATQDPRFSAVTLAELASVTIEVSVLSPLILVKDLSEIVAGRDGVVLRRGYRSGVFLPQVATEQGWDRDTFLEHLCLKAGVAPGSHKLEDTKLFRFTAEVFGEHEKEASH